MNSSKGMMLELMLQPQGDKHRISLSFDFAFIEFTSLAQAQAALKLDGEELKGRRLKVNMAREKPSGSSGDQGRRRW